ncbi:thyroid transcription factor 1-associated protein 26 homolog [Solea solea]|uniref:thyroid transcription factor 1-associated protein 26 homolog n=1 Tax=Solea solea TaxID=90069 RepID=UPI00272C50A7|nr:thyroid transcription factor 1-associated protein 26 homolog [Solea solea]
MAPTGHKTTSKTFTAKGGNKKTLRNSAQDVKKKRKWTPEHKIFDGSVQEGQGFAFKRKEKARHEYNRLLRKERRRNTESTLQYKDEYPEHLRHLYLAEAEKLKQEAWTNRVNRTKLRVKGREEEKETTEDDSAADAAQHPEDAGQDPEVTGASEPSGSVTGTSDLTAAPEKEVLPMSNRMKKKLQKKTSYQKTKEEFESVKEKQRKKKEEYLKNKQQREEAVQKYKEKKMETFQMLKKKTKKGQPNLNLQMDYLLQKIQGNPK